VRSNRNALEHSGREGGLLDANTQVAQLAGGRATTSTLFRERRPLAQHHL